METAFLSAAVVGATEFLQRLQARDYFAAITIAVAGAIGLVAGLLGAPGVGDAWQGLVEGLAASGAVTVAQKVG